MNASARIRSAVASGSLCGPARSPASRTRRPRRCVARSSPPSISRERIRDEYSRFLESDYVVDALTLLRDFGLFKHTVPELEELTRMPDHGANHPLSLWDHTMRVVANVPPELQYDGPLCCTTSPNRRRAPASRTAEPVSFITKEVGPTWPAGF